MERFSVSDFRSVLPVQSLEVLFDHLISLHRINSPSAAALAMDVAVANAGFTSGFLVGLPSSAKKKSWSILAKTNRLAGLPEIQFDADKGPWDVFPDEHCVEISANVDCRQCANFDRSPKDQLLTALAGHNVTAAAAVYLPAKANRCALGLIACGGESAEVYRSGLETRIGILRLTAAAISVSPFAETERQTAKLSTSERSILELLAEGLSPTEIAEARSTSIRTVRNQMESARKRVGATTAVNAVAIAIESGMIAPEISTPR